MPVFVSLNLKHAFNLTQIVFKINVTSVLLIYIIITLIRENLYLYITYLDSFFPTLLPSFHFLPQLVLKDAMSLLQKNKIQTGIKLDFLG